MPHLASSDLGSASLPIRPPTDSPTPPPFTQRPNDQGIAVTGFSPLGSSSYVELDMAAQSDSALDEPLMTSIAAKHGKSPAQVTHS